MPTYLCHGFRWKRRSIRVYVVVQNLDDAAPEWIIKRGSPRNLIESFYDLFDFLPECALPTTRSSSAAPPSNSVAPSSEQVSISEGRNAEDDDATSHYTTPSSGATRTTRSSSRSRSQNRAAATLHHGSHHQQQQSAQPGLRDKDAPAHRRQASSSSHRRQGSGTTNGSGADAIPLPHTLKPSTVYHHHHEEAPPSPPNSQPCRPSSSQISDAGAASDPILSQSWSPVKLLEEHDPANLHEVSRPYAYVADYVTRIDASCSIVEEIQRYETRVRSTGGAPAITGPSSDEMLNPKRDTTKLGKGAGWFEQLRDQLQRGEEIRWYVVVNGDEDRPWPAGEGPGSSSAQPEFKTSAVHHAQSAHQESIFEEEDRDLEIRREQLRRELGYDEGGVDKLLDRRLERRPKPPDVKLPPEEAAASSSGQKNPATPRPPKSPGRGTLRRFFSRTKSTEEMTSRGL